MSSITEIVSGKRHVVYTDGFCGDALTNRLALGILEITYKKRNGEERAMKSTLHPSYIPPGTDQSKALRDVRQITCIDVNKKAWRTFQLDSIIQIEEHLPDGRQMVYVKRNDK